MAEYIDIKDVISLITSRYENPEICEREIRELPVADVVPVVRGEWKWQEVELKKLKLGDIPPKQGECWCNWWDSAVNLSGFCSCGERITE